MSYERWKPTMRTQLMHRKTTLLGVLGALFMLTQIAHAFYDPSLGRWINRDPIGERGFGAVARLSTSSFYDDPNPYLFIRNEPVSLYDAFGLKKAGNQFLILGEHRERDCPPCTKKKTNICPFAEEPCRWPYEEQDCGKGKMYELLPGSSVAMRPRAKGEKPQVY